MAGFSSSWTKLGSNTNSSINTDTDSPANVSIVQTATGASGINAQVRHECHMWNIDTADTSSKSFDWAVNGDFTVVVNSAGQTVAVDPGAIEVEIEGTVDNSNWQQMQDMGDYTPGTTDAVGVLVYDFDTYGRMPYMRITMNSANASDNSAKPFKVNVFMHNL